MAKGSETDPEARLAELERKRTAIEAEMTRIGAGDIPLLDATELKDRFLQFMALARELLGDFREVEQNLRQLAQKGVGGLAPRGYRTFAWWVWYGRSGRGCQETRWRSAWRMMVWCI